MAVNKVGPYKHTEYIHKDGSKTYTIHDWEIFSEVEVERMAPKTDKKGEIVKDKDGKPKMEKQKFKFDDKYVKAMKSNIETRQNNDGYLSPVHTYHREEDKEGRVKYDIKFAGHISNPKTFQRESKEMLSVDWEDIPEDIFSEIKKKKWGYRSIEISKPDKKEISSVAILDYQPPELKLPLTTVSESPDNIVQLSDGYANSFMFGEDGSVTGSHQESYGVSTALMFSEQIMLSSVPDIVKKATDKDGTVWIGGHKGGVPSEIEKKDHVEKQAMVEKLKKKAQRKVLPKKPKKSRDEINNHLKKVADIEKKARETVWDQNQKGTEHFSEEDVEEAKKKNKNKKEVKMPEKEKLDTAEDSEEKIEVSEKPKKAKFFAEEEEYIPEEGAEDEGEYEEEFEEEPELEEGLEEEPEMAPPTPGLEELAAAQKATNILLQGVINLLTGGQGLAAQTDNGVQPPAPMQMREGEYEDEYEEDKQTERINMAEERQERWMAFSDLNEEIREMEVSYDVDDETGVVFAQDPRDCFKSITKYCKEHDLSAEDAAEICKTVQPFLGFNEVPPESVERAPADLKQKREEKALELVPKKYRDIPEVLGIMQLYEYDNFGRQVNFKDAEECQIFEKYANNRLEEHGYAAIDFSEQQ